MPDFPIIDSHVHLADPGRFGYAWTKNAPSLNRRVVVDDLARAAGPVKIEKLVFVEVDVDLPQHIDEAKWIDGMAASDPRIAGMVAALPLERGNAVEPELDQLRQNKVLRGIRRLIQNQPDPDF